MTELYAALQPVLDEHDSYHGQQVEAQDEEAGAERAVQLAIMGLPNVASVQPLPVRIACLSAASHTPISTCFCSWQADIKAEIVVLIGKRPQ